MAASGDDGGTGGGTLADRELALEWWRYQQLARGSRADRRLLEQGGCPAAQAGWDGVDERMRVGGRGALHLIVALVEAAPTDEDIPAVGAGPLEDLLHDHAEELIDDIESVARTHPGFQTALSGAWVSTGHLNDEAQRRLARWTSRPREDHQPARARGGTRSPTSASGVHGSRDLPASDGNTDDTQETT